jgi:ech hydrogenase subunit F
MFMMKTIFINLMTKYATRLYPFQKIETFPGVKGELKLNVDKCVFCGLCQIRCPSQCIQVDKKEKTWQVDPFACVYCGICVEACPTKCLYQDREYRAPLPEKDLVTHVQQPEEAAAPV